MLDEVVVSTKKLDVLVIAPHPDDAELGMGGAIVKMQSAGIQVGIVDLTDGEPTPHGSTEIRARETAAATQALGIDWRMNLGLPNRKLESGLQNRAKLAGVFRQTRPRWLFAPYWIDAHPDHVSATRLVEDARFWSKLTNLGYLQAVDGWRARSFLKRSYAPHQHEARASLCDAD